MSRGKTARDRWDRMKSLLRGAEDAENARTQVAVWKVGRCVVCQRLRLCKASFAALPAMYTDNPENVREVYHKSPRACKWRQKGPPTTAWMI
jgi:hypothetical protein